MTHVLTHILTYVCADTFICTRMHTHANTKRNTHKQNKTCMCLCNLLIYSVLVALDTPSCTEATHLNADLFFMTAVNFAAAPA